MSSTISAVSSHPSPMLLHSDRMVLAFSASSKICVEGEKRFDLAKSRSMGARIQSMSLMPASWLNTLLAGDPSSSFCTCLPAKPNWKKSTRPGTTASQPSCSMTLTTWLFAVGWNFTRISPTTLNPGLERSLTRGSSSNSRTHCLARRVIEARVNEGASTRARAIHFS